MPIDTDIFERTITELLRDLISAGYRVRLERLHARIIRLKKGGKFDTHVPHLVALVEASVERFKTLLKDFLAEQATKNGDGVLVVKSKWWRSYNTSFVELVIDLNTAIATKNMEAIARCLCALRMSAENTQEKNFLAALMNAYLYKDSVSDEDIVDELDSIIMEIINLVRDKVHPAHKMALHSLASELEKVRAQRFCLYLTLDKTIERRQRFIADLQRHQGKLVIPLGQAFDMNVYESEGFCAGASMQWVIQIQRGNSAFGIRADEEHFMEPVAYDSSTFTLYPDLNHLAVIDDKVAHYQKYYNTVVELAANAQGIKTLSIIGLSAARRLIRACEKEFGVTVSDPLQIPCETPEMMTDKLIEQLKSNPNLPILFGMLLGSKAGHAITGRYRETAEGCVIDFMDVNYGWMQFTDEAQFRIFLREHIKGYKADYRLLTASTAKRKLEFEPPIRQTRKVCLVSLDLAVPRNASKRVKGALRQKEEARRGTSTEARQRKPMKPGG